MRSGKQKNSRAAAANTKSQSELAAKTFSIQYERFKSREDALDNLLTDLKRFKVALPDNFQPQLLLKVRKRVE